MQMGWKKQLKKKLPKVLEKMNWKFADQQTVNEHNMSYEYYLQAHLNQEAEEIQTEKILSIFREYIKKRGENFIDIEFDDANSCTIYIDTDEPTASHLMVSRPCGGKLGECIYQVMQLGNFVFFEPDGKSAIILTEETSNHLPEDMIEALGPPLIAGNKEAFLELYATNR